MDTSVTVQSDETWKTHTGPIFFSNTYGGEDYDARKDSTGWDKGGIRGWRLATSCEDERPRWEFFAPRRRRQFGECTDISPLIELNPDRAFSFTILDRTSPDGRRSR